MAMPVLFCTWRLAGLRPTAAPWSRLRPAGRPWAGILAHCGHSCLIGGLVLLPVAAPRKAAAAPAPPAAGGAANPQPPSRPGTSLTLTAADNGRTVLLRRGETLRIVLTANAGTGFSWDLDTVDRRLVEPLAVEVRQAPGLLLADGSAAPLAGGPQQITVLFRALAPGRGALSLKFWRRWEGEGSVIDRFRVPLVVVGP